MTGKMEGKAVKMSCFKLLLCHYMFGPLLFGREDLRERTQIYDSEEALSPFYQLEVYGVKTHIMVRTDDEVSATTHESATRQLIALASRDQGVDQRNLDSVTCR